MHSLYEDLMHYGEDGLRVKWAIEAGDKEWLEQHFGRKIKSMRALEKAQRAAWKRQSIKNARDAVATAMRLFKEILRNEDGR